MSKNKESQKNINIMLKKNKFKTFVNKNKINIFHKNKNVVETIKSRNDIEFYSVVKKVVPDILKVYKKKCKKKIETSKIISVALDYFNDDYTEEYNRKLLGKDVYFYNEYKSNFNLKIFIEFFIYHFLFFLILGPFKF